MTIRVFVVDLQPMVAEALAQRLRAEPDMTIVGTASAMRDALEAAPTSGADVLTTSYALAGGDGVALARALTVVAPGIVKVMVSGFDERTILPDAVAAGCVGFVSKSASLDAYVLAVRAASSQKATEWAQTIAQLAPNLRRARVGGEFDLTPREFEVLRLFGEGLSDKEIASRLEVAPKTVRNHVQSILSKLGAHSKLDALAIAVRRGLFVIH